MNVEKNSARFLMMLPIFVFYLLISNAFCSRGYISDVGALRDPKILIVSGDISTKQIAVDRSPRWNEQYGIFYEILVENVYKGEGVKKGEKLLILDKNPSSTAMTYLFTIKKGLVFLILDDSNDIYKELYAGKNPWYCSYREVNLEDPLGKKGLDKFQIFLELYNEKDISKAIEIALKMLKNAENDREKDDVLQLCASGLWTPDKNLIAFFIDIAQDKDYSESVRSQSLYFLQNIIIKFGSDCCNIPAERIFALVKDGNNQLVRTTIDIIGTLKLPSGEKVLLDLFAKSEGNKSLIIKSLCRYKSQKIQEFLKSVELKKNEPWYEYADLKIKLEYNKYSLKYPDMELLGKWAKRDFKSEFEDMKKENDILKIKDMVINAGWHVQFSGANKSDMVDFLKDMQNHPDREIRTKARIEYVKLKQEYPLKVTIEPVGIDKEKRSIKINVKVVGVNKDIYIAKDFIKKSDWYEAYYKDNFAFSSGGSSDRDQGKSGEAVLGDFVKCDEKMNFEFEREVSPRGVYNLKNLCVRLECLADGEKFGINSFIGEIKSNSIDVDFDR